VADTGGDVARERARAAMARVGACLVAGEAPDAGADRDLAALAARIDSRIWEHCRTEAATR